ncbi:hypothetical protein BH10CYA1_BH10CYA1_17850 [soil metagenome]
MEFTGIWNTYIELSTTAYESGHYDVAETMLRAAYKQAPKSSDNGHAQMAIVLENLAEVFVKQTRFDKAERVYKRALGMHERNKHDGERHSARVCFKMAHLYLVSDRHAMFEKWYHKAIEFSKNSTMPMEEKAQYMLTLVQFLHKQDNHDAAWRIYREVLSLRQDMRPA